MSRRRWRAGARARLHGLRSGRLHPLCAAQPMRYGLLLCAIPLARAALALRLEVLWEALQQDALILGLMALYCLCAWRAGRWRLADGVLSVWRGLLVRRRISCRADRFVACEMRTSLPLRLCGAVKVELFFATARPRRSLTLLLDGRAADALCEALFPLRAQPVHYRPFGGEWLALIALSTNIAAETALVIHSVNLVRRVLGADLGTRALQRLEGLLQALGLIVPAGLSLLLSAVFLCTLCSLAISAVRVCGYQVGQVDGLLLTRGGLYTRVERRICTAAIQCIDVRRSPLARLLGTDAVHVYAGGFACRDVPLLFFARKQPAVARQLLPGLAAPAAPPARPACRLPWQFLWRPGVGLGLTVIFLVIAAWALPAVSGLLALVCVGWLVLAAAGLEAYFTEGFWPPQALPDMPRPAAWCAFTRGLTRHFTTVFLQGCTLRTACTSVSLPRGRADLRLHTPAGLTVRVRGLSRASLQPLLEAMAAPAPAEDGPLAAGAAPAAQEDAPDDTPAAQAGPAE